MRQVVRFLPGFLLLGVAATALVLVLGSREGGAESPTESVDQDIPLAATELGVPVTPPARPVPLPVEQPSLPEAPAAPAPATTSSSLSSQSPSTAALTPASDAVERVAAARSIFPPAAALPQSIPDVPATQAPTLPDGPSVDRNTLSPPLGDAPQLTAVPPLPDLPWPPSPLTPDLASEPPPPDP